MTDSNPPAHQAPTIVPRSGHSISRADIAKGALRVLYRLKDAGYQAFLVGGSVRDLLLGRHPKDFDVATDAHPEDVRALFSNSRLIGRRFRLAHVRFGPEIVEVATFRGMGVDQDTTVHREVSPETGRLLRDNVYGTIEEDVWRRDFTINALYYNIADFSIWDFVGGFEDIRTRTIRPIGDPEVRMREDPVRMLRAARFAAKLGFTIDGATAAVIPRLAPLVDGVPAARLFDEFLKIFHSGHAFEGCRELLRLGLFPHLFPATARWLESAGEGDLRLLEAVLESTDQRVADERPVTPMFLIGAFLWGPVRARAEQLITEGAPESQALGIAAGELTQEQSLRLAVPRRFSIPMREMLQLQGRFTTARGQRALAFLESKRFRAAYDLMMLRAAGGEVEPELAEWWTHIQTLDQAGRKQELGIGGARPAGTGKRRRRGGRRTGGSRGGVALDGNAAPDVQG